MIAVLRHELSLFYHSMTGYIFGAFLLLFTGIGALLYNINASVANFEYVLDFISIIFIVLVPILTMRIISEEKKQKTDQLLYSLPITSTDIIVGKFLSLFVVFLIPIIIICIYPLIFAQFGDVYLPTSYGSMIAFIFMGMALISMGMYISALTDSQGIAAGICVAFMLFNYFCSSLSDYVSATAVGALISLIVIAALLALVIRYMTRSNIMALLLFVVCSVASVVVYFVNSDLLNNLLPNIMKKISLFERFSVFVNGIFDLTGIVYYISVIVFFLFLCVQALEKRRYNG
ncbi:MAG: ABC transporter permease subunit [Butyrivibrio sp.]|nr:ABC transporter permease subunit [Butyrivibrio sp.]